MQKKELCKQCKKRFIDFSRSIRRCSYCLDRANRDVKKHYQLHRDDVLIYQQRYYKKNSNKIKKQVKEYKKSRDIPVGICQSCGKNKINIERSKSQCTSCLDRQLIYHKNVYETHKKEIQKTQIQSMRKNPSKYKQIKMRYYESHKSLWSDYAHNYRARKLSADGRFTQSEWEGVLSRYNHCCLWCGTTKRIEADHVVPLSVGGSNKIENIQPLCRVCNSKKSKKILDFRPFGPAILDWT